MSDTGEATMVRIGVVQMNGGADLEQNLTFVSEQLQQAHQQGVRLVVLPENFAQLAVKSRQQYIEPKSGGRVLEFLSKSSQEFDLYIIAGSVPTETDTEANPGTLARCPVFDNKGTLIANYDKIHLFDVDLPDGQRYRESDVYAAGSTDMERQNQALVDVQLNTDEGALNTRIGLSICYDLRFPELYRELAARGAQILCVPSAFTFETGQAHWQTLLQARAIENQCYVLAAAQVGKHANGRITWGHSMVVGPWGEIVAELETEPGLLVCDIDLQQLETLRTEFPALKHRRLNKH